MNTTFEVKIKGIDQIKAAFAKAPAIVVPILAQAVAQMPNILAKYTVTGIVPYHTGQLIQTFKPSVRGLVAKWGPTVKYARFVEFGTKPHTILPKNGKALFWKGAAHPVAKVNHPGSRANPYMERIRSHATDDINAKFKEAIDAIGKALSTRI